MPQFNPLFLFGRWLSVAAIYLKRECCRLAEWTSLGHVGIVGIASALACFIAAIVTLMRGYGQAGAVVLSMVLAFGLTASVLAYIVRLKTPGGVEKYFTEKREELLRLQEEYAGFRAQARSEQEAARQRALQGQAQEDARRRAVEGVAPQQAGYEPAYQGASLPAVSAPVGNASGAMDSVTCPRCGSTQITAQKKGFGGGCACCGALLVGPLGLLCGLKGANQIIVTCLKCGHQWSRG
jgi:tellurium resistance protein TerD